MILGKKTSIYERSRPFAVNVRKRNQRRYTHVMASEFEFCQMAEGGSVARIAPLLRQQLSPVFDLSEREAPFGANAAKQCAKAFHRDLQSRTGRKRSALPVQRSFCSLKCRVGSLVIPYREELEYPSFPGRADILTLPVCPKRPTSAWDRPSRIQCRIGDAL